jgi:hypothetical protein
LGLLEDVRPQKAQDHTREDPPVNLKKKKVVAQLKLRRIRDF